ncbi:alkaline phosphatase synthesis sensor protein PhoR [Abditibacteriota bacterium]|nr:alkaline phosphatase synthesis sensor protein PhoR [Abditibacteriota bacterium]
MPSAPHPIDEPQRLKALERYDILDSIPETEYDDLATLAASICGAPISLVSLVDADRQWFKARYGLDVNETPRSVSFCAHAIHNDNIFEVRNATQDPRFSDNALVTGKMGIRFYAGAPLITPDNFRLGTLCVIDMVPRELSDEQRRALEALARQVVSQLELRRALQNTQIADAEKASALAKMEASNSTLERFVEHAPAAIAMLDSSWQYVAVSRRFVQKMNLPEQSVVGSNHFRLCPFWPRSWRISFERALFGEVQKGQADMLHPDGRPEMFVDWEIYPWPGSNGQNEGVMLLIDDVTPTRRLEKLKSEFVSVVSHELRTPLTSIRGALGLLGGGVAGVLPERARQMIDIAHKNSERLVLLINDILDIEKIENGQMKFNFAVVDLRELVRAAIVHNQPYAEALGVTLRATGVTPDREPVWVRVDEARINQVMANLLSNAAKFTPNGGQVRVHIIEIEGGNMGRVRVEVRDQGPGVPPSFASRLFEQFAQADSSSTRTKGGTGLGLAISRAIIEKTEGQIGYTPPRDGTMGATFWFELERLSEPLPETSTTSDAADSALRESALEKRGGI